MLKDVPMPISTSISKFERFFRLTAGLDIDKEDLKRFEDFINRKIRDLVIRAEALAKANTRDIIMVIVTTICVAVPSSPRSARR